MESVFKQKKKKEQLGASFAVVANWATNVDETKFSFDMKKLADNSEKLKAVCSHFDPIRSMRYSSDLVQSLDEMIALNKALKKLPKEDMDRNNNQLRTALRRIEKVRNDDVWHIQFT
jgi:D-mannonate dehydratase